jgi:outer membrane receptor for ferrienterochelin and colicins
MDLRSVPTTMAAALPVQLSEIRQIEVIKGPVSALYGFNAVSGVTTSSPTIRYTKRSTLRR